MATHNKQNSVVQETSKSCLTATTTTTTTTSDAKTINTNVSSKFDISPATLEALKTLSSIGSAEGIEKLSNCDKLTASLEQIKAKKNLKLFEKLDEIRQDFSGLNHKIAQMQESITNIREVTSNLVKSLPPDGQEEVRLDK